jgi:phosphate-selective porin
VIPAAEFNPAKHGWGAIEVNVRYEQFRGPRDLFEQGFFTGTPAVVSWTTGFNWHLNRHMKSLVHYQDTRFDDPIDVLGEKIDSEKTLTFRIQFEI